MEILRIFAVCLAMLTAQAGTFYGDIDPTQTLPPVTPTPTAVVTYAPTQTPKTYRTLSQGARDDNVKRMQESLIRLGYLSGSADGSFGPKTRAAVEEFQKNNGLTADGVAGNDTLQLLFDGSPVRKGQPAVTATPSPAPTATPRPVKAQVKVTYSDQWGNVFYEQVLSIAETTLMRPDPSVVPEGYVLESEPVVQVLYDMRGKAYPASVRFEYESPFVPESLSVPVYYILLGENDETVLYETEVKVTSGSSVTVQADLALAPGCALVSAPEGFAVADEKGNCVPDRIEFLFEKEEE